MRRATIGTVICGERQIPIFLFWKAGVIAVDKGHDHHTSATTKRADIVSK